MSPSSRFAVRHYSNAALVFLFPPSHSSMQGVERLFQETHVPLWRFRGIYQQADLMKGTGDQRQSERFAHSQQGTTCPNRVSSPESGPFFASQRPPAPWDTLPALFP